METVVNLFYVKKKAKKRERKRERERRKREDEGEELLHRAQEVLLPPFLQKHVYRLRISRQNTFDNLLEKIGRNEKRKSGEGEERRTFIFFFSFLFVEELVEKEAENEEIKSVSPNFASGNGLRIQRIQTEREREQYK